MRSPGALLRVFAVAGLALASPTGSAMAANLSAAPPGASSCSGCHGARTATSVPTINGRSAAEITAALDEFRSGKRPATVMNRIAPGFTPDESRAIAAWLSEQPAP